MGTPPGVAVGSLPEAEVELVDRHSSHPLLAVEGSLPEAGEDMHPVAELVDILPPAHLRLAVWDKGLQV